MTTEEGNSGNEKSYSHALELAKNYQNIFGKDNFFIELHNHGIPEQLEILDDLIKISTEIDAPLVATNDSHYVDKEDASSHDALLCVQTNATIEDENRFKFEGEGYYVKSSEEMRELFPDKKFPNACDNTLKIAERINYEFNFGEKTFFPTFLCLKRVWGPQMNF